MPALLEQGGRLERCLGAACPKCGSLHAHRSHRKTLSDFLLSLAGIWPYRCKRCWSAFRAMRVLRRLGGRHPWAAPHEYWRIPE